MGRGIKSLRQSPLRRREGGISVINPGEVEQERGPQHPGWQSLPRVLNITAPFFEKFLFLQSVDTFSSNVYVLTGDYLTLVDPGNDYTAFMDVSKFQLELADIKKIVLTHGHPDHVMGAFELLRYPRIIQSGGFELILHEAAPPQLKEMVQQMGSRVTEVRGGETLELSGLEWEVIHTPGHTIDGICLYHPPTKTVFTGDTVLPDAVGGPDPRGGGSLEHYLFGLRALLRRDVENVLPGHGLPVAGAGRKVIEETYESVMMKVIGAEDPIPWIQGATALAQKGLFEEAVFCCEKEITRNPEDVKTLEIKAFCLNDLGRSQEALEVFDKLLVQKPDHIYVLMGKGCAFMGLGRYDESLSYFDQALKIAPGIREAQVYKGMALYVSGKHEEAMDIEGFRTEFMGRFKEELLKKTKPSGSSETEEKPS
jgi:glyoxylase-like metal-dependent hydrolase (beta-lactamase superfamily II)